MAASEAPPGRSLSQQFLTATLWNTVLFPARLLVGLVASVIYYGRLSLDQVGVLFLLTSLAATVGLYADLGIERTLPRFLPEVERTGGRAGVQRLMTRVIRLKLVVLLILTAGLLAFSQPLTRALANDQRRELARIEARLGTPGLSSAETSSLARQAESKRRVVEEIETQGGLFLAAVAALLLLGALFDVYMQFLTAYLKQRAWNLITLASTLLQPVLVSVFVLAGWQIRGVLVGLVVTPLVCAALARWQVHRASRELAPERGDAAPDARLGRRFARFAAVTYVMQVTTWMYDLQFVVFLSAATLSLADVAILGFAYKFAKDFLGYVWTPLTGVMTPVLARVHVRGEPSALREANATLTRVIWLLVLPAGVGLSVLTPRILETLYPKYTETATLIVLFVFFTFGESLLAVPQNVLMVAEHYASVMASRVVALLSVPLVYVLLPRYGLVGVAVAVGIVRLLSRAITLVDGMRRLGLGFPLAFAARVAAAAIAMGAALLMALRPAPGGAAAFDTMTRARGLLPLLAAAALGAIVYGSVLRLLGGLHDDERRRLLGLPVPLKPLLRHVL
jgi:O-antigen/teichoic acid export membrane protein